MIAYTVARTPKSRVSRGGLRYFAPSNRIKEEETLFKIISRVVRKPIRDSANRDWIIVEHRKKGRAREREKIKAFEAPLRASGKLFERNRKECTEAPRWRSRIQDIPGKNARRR